MKRVIRLSEKDNVAVVLCDLSEGEFLEEIGVTAREAVPYGHKIALADIRPGKRSINTGKRWKLHCRDYKRRLGACPQC